MAAALSVRLFRAAPPPPSRHVLLITIDTLRADALGAYGNPTAATPWIDRLAAAGRRFTNARAHNVVTLPSHANILTGRLPPDHGVRDNAGFRLPAGEETLATRLKAAGFHTGAFISAFPLDSRFGLGRGFDVYDDGFVDAAPRPAFLEQERAATATVAAATKWIASFKAAASSAPARWFAWVHLYEPHYPYAPPSPFASRFQSNPYAGEVAAADAALQPLLQPLLDAGAAADTLVIVTADHGESLGDHGEATHGLFAYEAALRIPLVIFYPPLVPPDTADAPAGHVDLVPTILETLGLSRWEGLRGRSLSGPLEARRDAPEVTYFEALSGSLNRGWAPLSGVVVDGLKYIDLPLPELYDLRADPREARNLSADRPADMTRLAAHLKSFGASEVRRVDETAEVTNRLRALGYVSSSTPRRGKAYTEADDPKRLIGVDSMLQDIVGDYLRGDVSGALARARSLVVSHPEMRVALLQLAHLEREAGHLPEAIAALGRAIRVNPGDTEAAALLGAYLTAAGRAKDAVQALRPYASPADADVQVLVALALAEATLGQTADARRTLDKARGQDPANGRLLVTAGTVELMAGRRAEARAAFESALTINETMASAHSSLAALDAEEGRTADSLRRWRRAVGLDSEECRKLLAIGLSLERAGRTADARPYIQLFADVAPPRYDADRARARAWLGAERR